MAATQSSNVKEVQCYLCHDSFTLIQDIYGEWKPVGKTKTLNPKCDHATCAECFKVMLEHHSKTHRTHKGLSCGVCRTEDLLSPDQKRVYLPKPEVDSAPGLIFFSTVLSMGTGVAAGVYQVATRDEDDASGSTAAIATTLVTASLTIVPIVFFQTRSAYQRSGLKAAASKIADLLYEAFCPAEIAQ